MSYDELRSQFGKVGEHLYYQARGVHFGEVQWQRQRQSIAKEETYDHFLHSERDVQYEFKKLAVAMISSLKKHHHVGRTLNIKVRDDNFNTITRAITRESPWPLSEELLTENAQNVFEDLMSPPFSVRLLGMSMSNLQTNNFEEMTLF